MNKNYLRGYRKRKVQYDYLQGQGSSQVMKMT